MKLKHDGFKIPATLRVPLPDSILIDRTKNSQSTAGSDCAQTANCDGNITWRIGSLVSAPVGHHG